MRVVNKGVEILMVKVLTIFTTINLSNNRFCGEILKGLIVINLSSNSFLGHVHSSLGNLTTVELSDLSQNEFSGEFLNS